MSAVRLLAFSDLHRDRTVAEAVVEASVEADVVVGAGDFGTRGEGERDTLEVLARGWPARWCSCRGITIAER